MANPNLTSPTAIYGTTHQQNGTTTETTFLTNASGSGNVFRIASLYAVNIDGSSAVDATVRLYDAASGGNPFPLVYQVSVPANATVTVITADAFLYLMENKRLTIEASANSSLAFIVSYELIS